MENIDLKRSFNLIDLFFAGVGGGWGVFRGVFGRHVCGVLQEFTVGGKHKATKQKDYALPQLVVKIV